jgi:hypothetical protein
MLNDVTVLIVEDGDEYLENLERFVSGPRYLQAHSGAEAISTLRSTRIDLIYLDMRFDRIAHVDLFGDHAEAVRENNGDANRAWRFLQNNQGLFILDALQRAGLGDVPVILAYDFSREERRLAHLRKQHPRLAWVPDAVTPEQIRTLMEQQIA